MFSLVGNVMHTARRATRRIKMASLRGLFEKHGQNFWFDPDGVYSYGNVSVGHDVSLGLGCMIIAAKSKVIVGSNVMLGPNVTLVGGGHDIARIGVPMSAVVDKTGNEDLGVVIEDDVWIGAGSTVLHGVVVHRGAVIAAGSVVTKSVPSYAIVAGNPARVLRFRWSASEILRHEEELYPRDERLTEEVVRNLVASPEMLPPER